FTSFFAASIAVSDKFTESVLIYVIRPASYNLCATLIVRETENPNFKLASCCNVDVVNGAVGFLVACFICTSETLKLSTLQSSNNAFASFSEVNCLFNSAFNLPFDELK